MFLEQIPLSMSLFFFFFNDTATTEIYTLSLHDALPICIAQVSNLNPQSLRLPGLPNVGHNGRVECGAECAFGDRKSTRLNSSHDQISYAVFCLKKKTWTFSSAAPLVVQGYVHFCTADRISVVALYVLGADPAVHVLVFFFF